MLRRTGASTGSGGSSFVELRQQGGGADRVQATLEMPHVPERARHIEVVALEVVQRVLGVGERVRTGAPVLHRCFEVVRAQRSCGVENDIF